MATQGLVSIVVDGEVTAKIVAGCNGYEAEPLCERLMKEADLSHAKLREYATECGLGCGDCLVIQGIFGDDSEGDLGPLYREKFHDPEFNPRWKHGTAAYRYVISIDTKTWERTLRNVNEETT